MLIATLEDGQLVLRWNIFQTFFGCKRPALRLPIENILCIRTSDKGLSEPWKGVRSLGLHIPRWAAVGSFRGVMRPTWEYWNVVGNPNVVEVFLRKGDPYSRVLVNVPAPRELIDSIVARHPTPDFVDGDYRAPSQEVCLTVKGRTVRGTITYPEVPGHYPAVLFIQGSGATDRDWNSKALPGTNGSAALLANQLARKGVVTLRYDKCGIGDNKLPEGGLSWTDYSNEQSAMLEHLAKFEYVDNRRVMVLGHSEGTMHAMRLCRELPAGLGVVGLILMAPPGRPLQEVIRAQLGPQFRKLPMSVVYSDETAREELERLDRGFESIRRGVPLTAEELRLGLAARKIYNKFFDPRARAFSRELLPFDPRVEIGRIPIPVLILCGGKDLQIHPVDDAQVLVEAAAKIGKEDVSIRILDDADHVFKYEETPRDKLSPISGLEYNAANRILDPQVVPAISRWLYELIPELQPGPVLRT